MIFNKDTNIKDIIERLAFTSVKSITFSKSGLIKDTLEITMTTDTNYRIRKVVSYDELYKTDFDVIKYLSEKMTEELYYFDKEYKNADSI